MGESSTGGNIDTAKRSLTNPEKGECLIARENKDFIEMFAKIESEWKLKKSGPSAFEQHFHFAAWTVLCV